MKIIKLAKNLVKYIVLMMTFSVAQVLCELFLPKIMSNIVDIGISNSDNSYIYKMGIIMIVIAIFGCAANILVVWSTSKFSNKYGYNIRKALYSKINTFSKKEIDSFGASTLITRSTNNVSNITSTFSFGLRLMIFAPVMGIGASIMAYKTAPNLANIVVIALIVLFVLISIVFVTVYPKFDKIQKLLDELNAKTREILSGLRVVKSFNKQHFFKKRFDKINKSNKETNDFINKILFLIQPIMMLTINIATIIIIYVSTGYLENNTLEIGAMMAFIQYMATILMSFLMLIVIIINIPRVAISFKRINEILVVNPTIQNTGTLKISELQSLEFKNVFFKYEDATGYLLKDISFKLEKGEKIGIIGSSGSGKTTIINLLLRHIEPTSGSILINGIDIKEYDIESLRNIYSYTPQKTLLFKGTIKENLAFGDKYNVNELDEALKIASIDDFVNSNKERYDFNIEQSAINLSGGQKQRMSIARALLNKGDILLFDDSFSAVDYITDKKIRTELRKNYSDKIIVIVTQRVGTIKESDKILVIDEGKIESVGSYDYLEKNSKVFKEFILSQEKEVL